MALQHHTSSHAHGAHEHSLIEELVCHLPYAAFSVALSFVFLAFMQYVRACGAGGDAEVRVGYHILFHALHYVHLVFAIVGTVVAFSRFSRDRVRCFLVSLLSPAFFCTLSDVLLPALAGKLLGLSVALHVCFFSLHDLLNVLPFMAVGLITGYAVARHDESALGIYALNSHFVHIFVSSLASTCYVASYGLAGWAHVMGALFLFLVVAVVVPCTFSDVVVPMFVARWKWSA